MEQVVSNAKSKFQGAAEHLKEELKKLRTGRANASMLDSVTVEVYGTKMPLNQTATISVPDSQLIQITPYDANNLAAISNAIRDMQSLGLNPMDDGHVVRVPIPPLNEERRREIVKMVRQKQEDTMITLRNVRHDAMEAIEGAKKEIGEDAVKRFEKQIEEAMSVARKQVEEVAKVKEQEVMTL